MESLGTVVCERCSTEHEIVKVGDELAIKSGSNINFEKGRKYIISCIKCRAFLYIGDKVSQTSHV